jgi:3-phosphoshikimate 1-carboxyvinyltransferase
LDPLSTQADRKILTVLQNCGAIVECTENKVTVRQGKLQSFTCDATDCPDLFPPLIALATGSPGVSRITGVHRLIHKESNRAQALVAEFTRLGIAIRVESDTMLIEGGVIRGGQVEAHQDHRIVMALAVAGLRSQQPVNIAGAECVAKSYPNFFEDLKSIGGKIDE